MLSSNLRAIFRSLLPSSLDATELMDRANHLFRQSALPTQYATLVYGKAMKDGGLEIVNAGHLPVLLAKQSGSMVLESTSQPLGVFGDLEFSPVKTRLERGDTLVLYTDGISEAANDRGEEYGIERLRAIIEKHCSGCPEKLVDACKLHLDEFRGRRERFDDETLLAIQYSPAADQHSHGAVV